ncbi:unnamed protein product [Microthlaspi erraticum]|uniref:Uncharacterized protein n=1 Tax=Microthlaspi erraticum TaxID=1685480 RepID=A0A6D2I786_9BRAS|nr:unnamed protein product [Microthlaspi erraticum]
MDIKFCKTNLLIEHKELDGRPPVYTLVGHEDDCEKRSLSSIELRIELRIELKSGPGERIWVSLSATTLRSMRLQG